MRSLPLAGFLAFVVSVSAFAAGCGCDPGNNGYRAPLDFQPSSVEAYRTPQACGAVDPDAAPGDVLSLEVVGATDVAPPYTAIDLDVTRSATQGQAVPLVVSQGSSGTVSAKSTDGSIRFTFTVGSNAGEIDPAALASVVVAIDSMPSADGEPLAAHLLLRFDDGSVLDRSFSAPVHTPLFRCVASPSH